ncbi:MAG: GTPase HflX [SAR324 cluster bacterium]|uniref:GTPase HflX n=1 Tax=SAR324 cluster bacterium TaxID=2024889 RepID=A0A2A4T3G3_9DELT|nr:MAG: GTPase HflX [SAR324 cluster bacterium]
MIEYSREVKKAYILSVRPKNEDLEITLNSLSEMRSMATTMGFDVIGEEYQSRNSPDPKSYMGTGKLQEIKQLIEDEGIKLVLFDHDLSPNQARHLEECLDSMVWDRTQLILEIFANHARTPESKDQVELAQLKYMLPRLVGMWAHLDREKGGIGASKGTGEKQVNIDRNLVRKRISRLEQSLKRVAMERQTQAKRREDCFQVGIVGYTNAGKTSLMNGLTDVSLLTQDQLFATLDSTTRVLPGPINPQILLSDTVGFIRNLPHNLVASFRSTLSVVKNADLLLHVVDASSNSVDQHIETTRNVLKEIGADNIPCLLVFNKVDRVTDRMDLLVLSRGYGDSILTSSLDETSVNLLRDHVKQHFSKTFIRQETKLTYDRANLLDKFYKLSTVEELKYEEDGIYIVHSTTPTNSKILNASIEKG